MNVDRHADAPSPTSRVGEQLHRTRLHLQLSLEQVNIQTRISLANLRAIEASLYAQLPAEAYTKGLIRLYGDHLGLDGEALSQQFLQERYQQKDRPFFHKSQASASQTVEPDKMAKQARVSSATAAICLFSCIAISFTGFCLYYNWNPLSYLTDKALLFTSAEDPSFHPADPTTSGARSQNRLSLQAVFYKDCQVRVILDDQPAISHAYMKGATIQWEARHSMQLDFFEENCAELQSNGTLLPPLVFHQGRATLRLPQPVHGQ